MLTGLDGGLGGLEFGVLGPLEVRRDGRPLRLGGERQRALLALLLINADVVVSSDQLVDQLFGDDNSEARVNALQVAVSRLRRVLDEGAGGGKPSVLATQAPGYVLRAGADRLDVSVFERLLGEGRRALAAGDPAGSVATLRRALALWRGPALADLALLDSVQPEIRRLEELRLSALMERVDAELALGAGAELVAELEALAAANPFHERVRGQLMLALYRSGRQADALAAYRQTKEFLRDELGLEPSRALQELEQAILRQETALERPIPAPRRGESSEEGVVVCPFKGLACFDAVDAPFFFGREAVIADLVARLAGATLVGVIGPSGAGKSSVLRAGIMPALAGGALPASERWSPIMMRPGEHPMSELSRALGADLRSVLDGSPGATPVVIAVDQFEEVFTACNDPGERGEFIELLVRLALDPNRRAFVVLSLRADFYGQCAAYPRFADLLSRNHVLVGQMQRDELARAIELPAARAGLQVERDLVDVLVGDLAGEPGGLPVLSTMLLELWRRREGRVLSFQTYRLSGGVRGAVARLAEDTFGRLSSDEQSLTRTVMLRLAVGDLTSVARRRVPLSTFDGLHGADRVVAILTEARLLTISEGEVEVAHEALLLEWPRFRGWLDEDDTGRRLHEHLAASAREWSQRGRDTTELYRGARLAATLDWGASHSAELNQLEREFLEASRERTEHDRRQAEREASRQRRLNRRLRALLSGAAVLLAVTLVAGLVALVKQHDAQTASRIALARQLGSEAVVEPRIDLAMLLAKEAVNLDRSPQTEGTLLATLLRSPAAIATFSLPIGVRPQRMTVSPDGRTLVVTNNDGSVHFFDTRTRAEDRPPISNVSSDPAPIYSKDGSRLLLADFSSPPVIDVLDGRTFRSVARLPFDPRWVANPEADNPGQSLFFSADGKSVYYGYEVTSADGSPGAGYLDRWTLPEGRLVSTVLVSSHGLLAAREIGNGNRLVVLTDDGAEWLNAQTLGIEHTIKFKVPAGLAPAAVISPDGASAAFGGLTGAVSFIDLATGGIRTFAGAHTSMVLASSYSPDGRVLVTTGSDRKVVVWDPASATPLQFLIGHAGRPLGIAFSADGQSLYTCALDGIVLEWDLGSSRRFGQPFSYGAPFDAGTSPDTPNVPPLAVSPDGLSFAVWTGPSSVGILSTRTLSLTATLRVSPTIGGITALAWSPVAAQLAVAGHNGGLQLWDTDGRPHLVRSLPGLSSPYALPEAIQAVAFSSDGRQIAATDVTHTPGTAPVDGRLAVWQTNTGTLLNKPIELGAPGQAVAFSADRRWLAAGLQDGRVILIDQSTGRETRTLHPIEGDNGGIFSVAFSPNGTLATGTSAGIIELWDPTDGKPVEHPVLVAAAPVASISFDTTGDRFATTGGSDGSLKVWITSSLQQEGATLDDEQGTWGTAAFTAHNGDLIAVHDDGHGYVWPANVSAWEDQACAVAGRNMTHEEWQRFITGHDYTSICQA